MNPPVNPVARAAALERLYAALAADATGFDFFATLRRIETLHPQLPRLGEALRPRDEPLRVGQDPELDFAPAALSSFTASGQGPPRLAQRFLGLWGPMGPLPLHLTEYARERAHNHGDPTLARFADLFHHRWALLFYRAWAQAQPGVHLDRPDDAAWSRWVGALIGVGPKPFRQRDAIPDAAKLHHAATLARGTHDAEGLRKIVTFCFGVPARVESHVGHWLPLGVAERTRLLPAGVGARVNQLGRNAVAGSRVWDRQYRFRLHLGPLSYEQYEALLPGRASQRALRDWLRQVLGYSITAEVCLQLRADAVPRLTLGRRAGQQGRLGLTTWLGTRRPPAERRDRSDLRIRPEAPTSRRP